MSNSNESVKNVLKAGTLLFLFLFTFHFSELSAQDTIPDSLVKERIQNIQFMLENGKPAAKM
jgi:hypothetical protein